MFTVVFAPSFLESLIFFMLFKVFQGLYPSQAAPPCFHYGFCNIVSGICAFLTVAKGLIIVSEALTSMASMAFGASESSISAISEVSSAT